MKTIYLVALTWLLSVDTRLMAQSGAAATTTTNAPALDQEQRELKPLDVLRYNVLEDPAGRGQFPIITISELGDAQFPVSAGSQEYIPVKAAGRKLAELRKELKQKLDADYYQNATVNLELHQTRDLNNAQKLGPGNNAKVIVFGSMNATIPLRDDQKLMLSELFAQLSNQSQYAQLKKVELQRIDPATKLSKSSFINVKKLLDGDLTGDIELKDGDKLKVVDRNVIF